MKDPKGISVSIMGREFRVAAPEGEERQLIASVEYLNKKMKEIRDAGKIVGNERIAIMAALNIAHEQVANGGKPNAANFDGAAFKRRIAAMQETLDSALAADQENLF
jgi:cell division protein ZapA